jgi:excinuclease UvrABC helicase subunit UvrB
MNEIIAITILASTSLIAGFLFGYLYGKGYEDRHWKRTMKRDPRRSETPEEIFKRHYGTTFIIPGYYSSSTADEFKDDLSFSNKQIISVLSRALKQAIEDEDYETAAKLTDKLNKLKGNNEVD